MVVQLRPRLMLDRFRVMEGIMAERRPSGGDGVVPFIVMLRWAARACPF